MQLVIYIISFIVIGGIVNTAFRKKAPLPQLDFEIERQILQQYVLFYQVLNAAEKERFEESARRFLQEVRITGVNTKVEDVSNIQEVLLYPDLFDRDFHIKGNGRDTLGMIGNDPMQNVMILSKQDLRNGFLNVTDKSKTAIHEFVHLIDKSDGDTDGLWYIIETSVCNPLIKTNALGNTFDKIRQVGYQSLWHY